MCRNRAQAMSFRFDEDAKEKMKVREIQECLLIPKRQAKFGPVALVRKEWRPSETRRFTLQAANTQSQLYTVEPDSHFPEPCGTAQSDT
jgi:hypothetical protein